jgi:hypothetical protein
MIILLACLFVVAVTIGVHMARAVAGELLGGHDADRRPAIAPARARL